MKTKKTLKTILSAALAAILFAGCSNTEAPDSSNSQGSSSAGTSSNISSDTVTLKGIVDLTPHNDIIEFVKDDLAKQGIILDIVSTASDATTNERVSSGEIDFSFHQHLPFLNSYNETNKDTLVSAGAIHVEPIAAYSNTYKTVEELPADKEITVVIPNDGTNEYRALRILEAQGWITLDKTVTDSLSADIGDVTEYKRKIKITEIDSTQIIGLANDFDIYIVNTNKALEAKLDTSKYIFRESSDSPYANIIAVRGADKDKPEVKAFIEALKSDKTKAFIENRYNGAVIPAK